jgi:hypothetical protein
MKKEFTKNDLEFGMVVVTRNRGAGLISASLEPGVKFNITNLKTGSIMMDSSNLLDSLEHESKQLFRSLVNYDIMEVYSDYTMTKLLWKRKEIKLTEAEKTILGNLRCSFNYIARDKDSRLYVYDGKPSKRDDMWYGDNAQSLYYIFPNTFLSFIKWEDEEPYLISDLLKGEK